MRHYLLAWLGLTDLKAAKNNTEAGLGPIGQAVAGIDCDCIVLLSNFEKSDNTGYLKWLKARTDRPVEIITSSLSSPTDFGEIYEAVVDVIERLRGQGVEAASFTFHLSPGTPAMAAVWIIVSKTRCPATLIESSKQGGVRVVSLPFDISAEFLPDLLRQPDEQLERLTAGLPAESPAFDDIIHQSRQMRRVLALARRVALHQVPVLIEGESGTGKELLARAIHSASPRATKPFIAVNCGAIPSELVESELFGHEKGAFTGAHARRDGHFLKAEGGTIFLDEVGELPLPAQVKLLRVLQEREITPLGASEPRKLDVRIISATNRNLIEEVAKGSFREDLFYRLAVFLLRLPPLREREGDLGLLTDALLERLNRENSSALWPEDKKLSPSARNLLLGHHWTGNVRELQNTLLRAAVLSSGSRITEDDVRQAILPAASGQSEDILNRPLGNGFNLPELLTHVAQHYLLRAMAEGKGNKTEAAHLVGLPSYQTLTNWLDRYKVRNGT
ncbi:MAG TPA: sigma-54 dependent transcriptional regulator [Pyrinomonadaceae bacterium]|jgi:DNA-binding NtrC family response regulator